jgi:hypothetical protein
MKTNDWNKVYKIDSEYGNLLETNLIYVPLTNEKNLYCMNFDHSHYYQNEMLDHLELPNRNEYTKELVEFFFKKEVEYLTLFQGKLWAPTIVDIDYKSQKIFFYWSGESCNQIIYTNRNLSDYCPNWEEQLEKIITDIYNSGYYKLTLYPHCFYIDNGTLKTFDFYSCVDRSDPYIELDKIKGMIGQKSANRFKEATEGTMLNFEILFKQALLKHIQWPTDILPRLYQQLFK